MTGSITIEVEPARAYMSPYGYWHYAKDFHAYADRRPSTDEFSTAPYFLYCRSIELLLKSFLLLKRITKKELASKRKGFSHDLHSIIRKSKELDPENLLKLKDKDDALVDRLSEIYDGKGFEYFEITNPVDRFHRLPPLEDVQRLSERLISTLEAPVRTAISDPSYRDLADFRMEFSPHQSE